MSQPEKPVPDVPDRSRRFALRRDLTDPRWMAAKAAGFVIVGVVSSGLILLEAPRWDIAAFLALAIWAFARAYYFAFYVIGHYIDPDYRYDGLISAIRHSRKNRSHSNRNRPDRS